MESANIAVRVQFFFLNPVSEKYYFSQAEDFLFKSFTKMLS
jgi:hypothetical protein